MENKSADPVDVKIWDSTKRKFGSAEFDRDEMVTTPVVASYLNTSAANLIRWRWEGRGPAYVRLGGRSIRYRWSDVEAWVEQNVQSPRS